MRVPLLAVLTLAATVQSAQALTIRDVIELSRSGISEEVLLALIEVDGSTYPTDAETLKGLKEAGVSDRVTVALVRSGRERPPQGTVVPEPPPPAADVQPQPAVVVIDHHDSVAQPVAVPVPVYVPVPVRSYPRTHDAGAVQNTYVPFQSGPPAARPERSAPKAPVYWGFGGKLRPDAWGQPRTGDAGKDQGSGKDKQ